ncbi:uncharacterized protein LOC119276310 [Triticum dicoccoides]|uniref:uncharacterized protein LOC119276310 n=1 Tax=Triticum dicoccoides TaxID=85692 RepID=UPI00188FB987|nr:uncharacterized protein LOC119276310 [Triticum dicoccoides]
MVHVFYSKSMWYYMGSSKITSSESSFKSIGSSPIYLLTRFMVKPRVLVSDQKKQTIKKELCDMVQRSLLTMKDVKLHHHSQFQYGPVRHEDLELQPFQFIFHMLFSTSTSSSWKKEISPTDASKVRCRAPPTRPQAARRVMPTCHQP